MWAISTLADRFIGFISRPPWLFIFQKSGSCYDRVQDAAKSMNAGT